MNKNSFSSRVILIFFSFIIFLTFLFALTQVSISSETTENIVENNLDKLINEKKEFLDLRMKNIEGEVQNLSNWISEYSNADFIMKSEDYSIYDGMAVKYKGENKTSLFIPKEINIDNGIQKQINLTEKMESKFKHTIEKNHDISCLYFISKAGALGVYPYMKLTDLDPSHDFRDDHYFKIALKDLNPSKKAVWTKPYYDWAGRGWIVTCVYPVYIDNELSYVIFADVTLKRLQETIADFQIDKFGYGFLIDYDGEIIYHPKYEFEPLGKGERLYGNIFTLSDNIQYKNIMKDMIEGKEGKAVYLSTDAKEYNIVSYAPIDRIGWSIGFDVNKAKYALDFKNYISQYFIVPIVIASILFIIGYYLLKEASKPIETLSTNAEKIASGEFIELKNVKGGREIETLANSLNTMSSTLREYMSNLIMANIKLETLFNSIKGLLYTVDKNYKIISMNSYGKEITKSLQKDFTSCKCYEFFKSGQKPCKDCPVNDTLSTGEESFREMVFGQDILHVWTFPIFDSKNNLDEVLVYSVKATEKVIIDKQFYQREKLASIGQMAAGITHELKSPLSVIKGCSYLLKHTIESEDIENDLGEEIIEIINEIDNSIENSQNIIYNLLDFSRKADKENELINLVDLINQISILNKKHIIEQDIDLIFNFKCKWLEIFGDLDSMKHIFLNIIENAIQAMPDGGELKITGQKHKNKVEIAIEDTGCGITEEELENIFEPFFTTKPRGIGTGIGLWIVKNEVNKNNGNIEISSVINEGTKVIVYFPNNELEG